MVELTRKGKKFLWTEACDRSFEQMKKALVSADGMGYTLNEGGDFILDMDASDIGIGGTIHQIQGEQENVIAYASRSLNKTEKNYCITEKELLAVRYFIQFYWQYLLGRHFRVRTDHQTLICLFCLKEPRGKIARWLEIHLVSATFQLNTGQVRNKVIVMLSLDVRIRETVNVPSRTQVSH